MLDFLRAHILTLALALVVLPWAGGRAVAAPDDEAPVPTPRERFEAHVLTLGAPSEDDAFRFEGELVLNGERRGTCVFEATVRADDEDGAGWTTRDDLSFDGTDGPGVRLESWADLDADLAPRKGAGIPSMPGQSRTHVWERTPEGLRIETTTKPLAADAASGPVVLPHEGPLLATMAAVMLFARSILDTEGVYETTLWDPLETEKANALSTLRLTSKGKTRFRGADAWVVEGTRARQRLTFAFHPETRAFVGATVQASNKLEIAFLPPGSGRDPVPQEVIEKVAAGTHLVQQREFGKAIDQFTEALAVTEGHVPALLGRARAQYYLRQYDAALADLDRVMTTTPDNPAPYELRGLIRERTGDALGAAEDYARVVALDPEGPHVAEMIARRGHARMAGGDLEGAEADYDLALERSPENSALWRGRGIVRERAGNLKGAIEDFEKACELDPSSPQDWFNLGLVLMRGDEPERAIQAFTTALDRSQPHPIPLMRRAVARLETGDEAGWLADVFAAARLAPREPVDVWPTSPRTDLAYAAALAAEGSVRAATRKLETIRLGPDASVDTRATALLWTWVADLGGSGVNPAVTRMRDFLKSLDPEATVPWSVELLRFVVGERSVEELRTKVDQAGDENAKQARLSDALFVEGARAVQRQQTATAKETLAAALETNAETSPAWFAAGILLGRLDGTEEVQVPDAD